MTAEVSVLHTLLCALDARSPTERPQIVLLQGVDTRQPDGCQAAEKFAKLSCVTLETFEIGGLGRAAGSRKAQATKVVDLSRLWATRHRLQRLLGEFQPDIIYSAQQRWDQRLAVPLAERSAAPRVVHLHYNVGPWLGSGALQALFEADMVLAISEFIRQDAINAGVPSERIQTLRNPAPDLTAAGDDFETGRNVLRRELAISDDAAVVGMVGRLSQTKGQLELLDAMLPLLRRHRLVHLVIAGAEDPPGNGIGDLLQGRAAHAGVRAQVHLLGHRKDIPAVLDGLDVFAHPSRHEPFGLAILEAMSRGLPVVAWREGGPVEIVSHPETGLLVPVMDVPALSEAIAALLANQDRRRAMGYAGRIRVLTKFRADEAADRFVALLGSAACSGSDERRPVRA